MRSSTINVIEDGYGAKGTGSSWYSALGDTKIPSSGIVILTFEVVLLHQTIEFGFAPTSISMSSYFGENAAGFCY